MSVANGSVHGLQVYADYIPIINFTTLQAFIPFLYICPTIVVMMTILVMYRRARKAMSTATMDHNIFALIMFYFMFNMLFYFGDYIHLNLPSSGLMTTWCAGIQPSRYFAILFVYAYYSNFGVIICPFLVCLIRLTILLSPRNNERLCRLIMNWFAIPFLFLVPLLLTICNIQVSGYCMQMADPFSFGSLIVYEGEEQARLNIIIHFSFSIAIFSATGVMSAVMFFKLRTTLFDTSSARTKTLTKRAEWSLSLTMISSVVPFVTNSICSITFLFHRPDYFYVLFLRPIGNDYETTMMPWVLFLTHPMFKSKKKPTKSPSQGSNFTSRSSQMF
ncbi:unnamed protein product [Caenorhabditis sp. 36 PRJEB53466]|nr:unnamed protein product [Caenorhabditis sp. 36 PRJEB53466]